MVPLLFLVYVNLWLINKSKMLYTVLTPIIRVAADAEHFLDRVFGLFLPRSGLYALAYVGINGLKRIVCLHCKIQKIPA